MKFRLLEKPLRSLIALPGLSESGKGLRPVLCFLHGCDEGPPTDIEDALTRHGPLRRENAARVADDFIVVAPQLPMRGDVWQLYGDAVQEIVRKVQKSCWGDVKRTYLTGFSFGGNGVFDLALSRPRPWAALWAVDPTRIPERDPGLPVWLSVGKAARLNRESFIHALNLTPVDVDEGADRVYLDEGADHVGSATLAYRDKRVYSWLLSKRLPPA